MARSIAAVWELVHCHRIPTEFPIPALALLRSGAQQMMSFARSTEASKPCAVALVFRMFTWT